MVTGLPSLQQETATGSTVSQTVPEQTVFTGTEITETTTTKLNSQSSTTKLPRTLVGFEKSTGTSPDTQTQGTQSSTKATQYQVTGSSEETDSTEVDSSASVTIPNPGGIPSLPGSIGTVNVPPSAGFTANPVIGTDSTTMDDFTHVTQSAGSQTVTVTQVTSTGNSPVSASQQTGGSAAANTAGTVTQPTSDPFQQTMGAAVTQVTSGGNPSPQTVGPAATNNAGAVTQVTSGGNSSQQTMAAPVTLEGNSSQNVVDPAVTIPTSAGNSSQPTMAAPVTLESNSSQNVVDPAVTIPTSGINSSQPTMGPAVTQEGNSVEDSSQPTMNTASVNQADSVVTLSGSKATVNLQDFSTVSVDQIGAVTQDSMGNDSSSGYVASSANTAIGSRIEAVTRPISGTGYTDTQQENITGENDVEMPTGEASERNYILAGETGNTAGYAGQNGTVENGQEAGAVTVTLNSSLEAVSVTGYIPGDGEVDHNNTTGSERYEISSGTVPPVQVNVTDEAESTAPGSDESVSLKNSTKNTAKSSPEEGTTSAGLVSGATGPAGDISHRNTTEYTLTTRDLSQGASSEGISPQGNFTTGPKNNSIPATNSTENPVHGSLLTGVTDPVNTSNNTSPIHAAKETTTTKATQMVNTTEGPSNLVVPTTTTPYSSENSKNETQNSNGSGGSVNVPPVEVPVYTNTTKTSEKISTTTSMTYVGVTQIVNETSVKLDNGDIIITQLIRYPNGTLTYRNITDVSSRLKNSSDL
ncbi:unnamed protein product [Nippostrongylus brasiliensis]|uniref:Mucin-19-like n=1 Tax=Nippostrongylus brasiliensis TaxID=27835 RepID=A0A0N4YEF0_NIPBR|nr:unnamed protein product [Nippostrongylus brasiliensis]